MDSRPEPTARLLIRALTRFENSLQERLHADGFSDVTVAQTNLLRHLNPDGMRQSALARDANVTKQAVSQAVRALQARDLIAVHPDPSDSRAKWVVYTERGRSLIRHALGHIVEMEQAWQESLGDDGYARLRELLVSLAPASPNV